MATATVAAIIVPCTSRKFHRPTADGSAVSLTCGSQESVQTAWLERLTHLPAAHTPRALYGGRGFQLSCRAAEVAGAPLFIVSAGLGLVADETRIPAYGLTISNNGDESIARRINSGGFSPINWWRAVTQGPCSQALSEIFKTPDERPIIFALTHPYAEMISDDLATLSDAQVARLRIIGLSIKSALPLRLRANLLPYDERLQQIIPGTRSDFAQRALYHFVSSGLKELPQGSINSHQAWVSAALATHRLPDRIKRAQMTDAEIIALIGEHLSEGFGVGKMLRKFRDEKGIACEQARFSRLYRLAVSQRGEAA